MPLERVRLALLSGGARGRFTLYREGGAVVAEARRDGDVEAVASALDGAGIAYSRAGLSFRMGVCDASDAFKG